MRDFFNFFRPPTAHAASIGDKDMAAGLKKVEFADTEDCKKSREILNRLKVKSEECTHQQVKKQAASAALVVDVVANPSRVGLARAGAKFGCRYGYADLRQRFMNCGSITSELTQADL